MKVPGQIYIPRGRLLVYNLNLSNLILVSPWFVGDAPPVLHLLSLINSFLLFVDYCISVDFYFYSTSICFYIKDKILKFRLVKKF